MKNLSSAIVCMVVYDVASSYILKWVLRVFQIKLIIVISFI